MKKCIALAFIVVVFITATFAQQKSKHILIGFDFQPAYGSDYDNALGFSAQYEWDVFKKSKFFAKTGYARFTGETTNPFDPNPNSQPFDIAFGYIPFLAGYKLNIGSGFYFSPLVGFGLGLDQVGNPFIYSIGLGVNIPVESSNYIDIGFRLEDQYYAPFIFNYMGLHAKYAFKLKGKK